tara:strand:+ start:207 stop:392 length:186 start_codon:yes stop_codon:yes gene_type:complete
MESRCAECFVVLNNNNNQNEKGMCDKCLRDNVAPRHDNSEETNDWGNQFKEFKSNILNKEY